MIKKLGLASIFLVSFISQITYAITEDEQITQDCEMTVQGDLIVGSVDYIQAVDECIESQMATTPVDQGQDGYTPTDND